jgi:hypothetical protein
LTTNWIDISEASAILVKPANWLIDRCVPADWKTSFPVNKAWYFYENTDWTKKNGQLFFNRKSIEALRKEILTLRKKLLFG